MYTNAALQLTLMYDLEGATLVKGVTSVAKDASDYYFVVMFVTKSAMAIHLVESA